MQPRIKFLIHLGLITVWLKYVTANPFHAINEVLSCIETLALLGWNILI